MAERSLVSRERMPDGWLNSPAGGAWFSRRADAFAAMAVRQAELAKAKKPKV